MMTNVVGMYDVILRLYASSAASRSEQGGGKYCNRILSTDSL